MMDHLWHRVPLGAAAPDLVHVVVEIPTGERARAIVSRSQLPERNAPRPSPSILVPGDYGFIPQTFYPDRDPLDALVLTTIPTIPGSVVEARPIGFLRIQRQSHWDDTVIAVRTCDPHVASYYDSNDLAPHVRAAIEQWARFYRMRQGTAHDRFVWKQAAVAREWIVFAAAYYAGLYGGTHACEAHP